jgi:3-isopropylmalate/(R)-2-methylmalate dehydratase small subunit
VILSSPEETWVRFQPGTRRLLPAIRGIPCILAETCSRIYYRNAINNGYPVLFVKGISEAIKAGEIQNGDTLEGDLATGRIQDLTTGKQFHGDAVSDLENDIMKAGGLFPYLKQKAK